MDATSLAGPVLEGAAMRLRRGKGRLSYREQMEAEANFRHDAERLKAAAAVLERRTDLTKCLVPDTLFSLRTMATVLMTRHTEARAARLAIYEACPGCRGDYGPSHSGSADCQCGSLASGGEKAHCSCDRCF